MAKSKSRGPTTAYIPHPNRCWMHHAEIDRLWAVWQASRAGQNPPLAGAAAIMDPWTEAEVDTRDTVALGYHYQ